MKTYIYKISYRVAYNYNSVSPSKTIEVLSQTDIGAIMQVQSIASEVREIKII